MQNTGRNSRETDGVELPSATSGPHLRPAPPTLPFNSGFRPAWWCRNPHLQTLWPYLFRTGPTLPYQRERLELRDGDFLDLDWLGPDDRSPIVLIIHGLCGDSQSHYVRGLASQLYAAGVRAVVLHHRGCSGEPNRLPRSYHGGDGRDIDFVLGCLRDREPATPLFAAGFSIGGSMLLNWLSRNRDLLTAACSVSTPLDLAEGVMRMEKGLSRIYQTYLVSEMKKRLRYKSRRVKLPINIEDLEPVRTFREFDGMVTAPLHGFRDAEEYYSLCSSRQLLQRIETPVLIVHAADDPLSTTAAIPSALDLRESGSMTFELSRHGGHCGFVSGMWPNRPIYWTDRRITDYFTSFLRCA